MNRELYDFTTPPDTPPEAVTTLYYFPHKKYSSMGLQPLAPAYNKLPCMAVHYNKSGKLLFTRFVFEDGTYRDSQP